MKMEVTSSSRQKQRQAQFVTNSKKLQKAEDGDASSSQSQNTGNSSGSSEKHCALDGATLSTTKELKSEETKEPIKDNVAEAVLVMTNDKLKTDKASEISNKTSADTGGDAMNADKVSTPGEVGGGEGALSLAATEAEDESKGEEEGRMVYLVMLAASLQTSLFSWLWQQLETKTVADDNKLYQIVQTMIKDCK